jgi:hypothetical protein
MTLRVAQSCHHEGDGWWTWAVWLEGDILDEVARVEYLLHPTFPHPRVVVTDRGTGFRIERTGWGEFRIFLNVTLDDGSTRSLQHDLELRQERLDGGSPLEGIVRGWSPLQSGRRDSPAQVSRGSAGDATPGPDPALERAAAPARLLVSSSLAEGEFANALRKNLEEIGLDVVGPDVALASGSDWQAELESAVLATDAVVVVVDPRNNSSWTLRDAAAARDAGRRVLPVLLGSGDVSLLPSWMQRLAVIRADRSDPGDAAMAVSRAILGG